MLDALLGQVPGLRQVLDAVGLMPDLDADRPDQGGSGRSETLSGFGSNPGGLGARVHLPAAGPRQGAPLLVLLHGCGQAPGRFAREAGWIALADRLGAPLLLPEQSPSNNGGRCFNWFEPEDIARERGEAASIRQMVGAVVAAFSCDPGRVFVAGLSAGGALAVGALAAYPEVFAAGAVAAALPAGCARDMSQAMTRMSRAGDDSDGPSWEARARALAPAGYGGAWPRLSIWHGEADLTVDPANAANLAKQWTALHGTGGAPTLDLSPRPGLRRRVWHEAVEVWTVAGMSHGFPAAGPASDRFVIDIGLPAVEEIARFWGLLPSA
ncbi:PHB depolymerase family esterase [Rhodovastum atsumiense]|uniref:PHB depolymerase family esterase n=1 Tax=Rhodovastum atsumiense TaxID=504468 RepID=A0A5M6J0H7_9PROT|nr:PHB depolymerase family esterase [Rhodovastum atsumiense]KAA5613709.1 PHB depolymerase family esterase [Rhodovastum atsumiense]CAH2599632.1 PHB depolymerase family esterase [Rhodovastum atsumiense]